MGDGVMRAIPDRMQVCFIDLLAIFRMNDIEERLV